MIELQYVVDISEPRSQVIVATVQQNLPVGIEHKISGMQYY
jgi:hypothetical protein